MNFGMNFGLFKSGSGIRNNVCMISGTDGINMGYRYLAFGTVDPEFTDNGKRSYSIEWVNDGSSPFVRIEFGDTGKEMLADDINILTVLYGYEHHAALWDETETAYLIDDQDFVDRLVLGGNLKKYCFYMGAIPNLFIHYDFAEVFIGDVI